MTVTTAMILAAGLGTRMRPLTNERPKPLIDVGGTTLLDRVLDGLADAGINKAIVNLHYKADMVRAHLASRLEPRVVFSDETSALLDTGGGVAHALPLIDDDLFVVTNSDALWRGGLAPVIHTLSQRWQAGDADALLALAPMTRVHGFDGAGDFFPGHDGAITRRGVHASAPAAYSGTQVVHRRLFADAPDGAFSFNRLWDAAAARGRLRGIVHDDDWFHVGTPDAIEPTALALSDTASS